MRSTLALAPVAVDVINYDDDEWTTFERQSPQTAQTTGTMVSPPSVEAPSFPAPSFDAPSFSAPSHDGTLAGTHAADPAGATDLPSAGDAAHPDDTTSAKPGIVSAGAPENNPYIARHVTSEVRSAWAVMTEAQLANSVEIAEKYGGWCDGVGHHCWDEFPRGKNLPRLNHTSLETCPCKEPPQWESYYFDNATNWDRARQVFCNNLIRQFDVDHPFPNELKLVVELTYAAPCHTRGTCDDGAAADSYGINPVGNLSVEYLFSDAWRAASSSPCVPAPSGNGGCGASDADADAADTARANSPFAAQPDGSKFDPIAVKRLFQQLQAGLYMYHQGGLMLREWAKPAVGTQEHAAMVAAMTKKFAAAFVHGGRFVIGSVGDSTLAGADNCYFDAWTNGLRRQLYPLFGAGFVELEVRNGGHNGGLPTDPQLACIKSIAGADVDMILHQAPFVTSTGPFVEDMVRRALIENGAITQSCTDNGEEFLGMYAPYGYSTGTLVEGQARRTHWYPSAGKSNWGRVGDGICHTNFTRSGSIAVAQRNWHPGPLGHQQIQDAYVFQWSEAIIGALVEIETAVEDGLSLDQMKMRWPRRTPVDPGSLPPPYFCSEEGGEGGRRAKMEREHPGLDKMLCPPNGPATKGMATCYTHMTPWHDAAWEDIVVTGDDVPAWDSHNMNRTQQSPSSHTGVRTRTTLAAVPTPR